MGKKKKSQETFKTLTTDIQQLLTSLSILIFPNNPRVNNKSAFFLKIFKSMFLKVWQVPESESH